MTPPSRTTPPLGTTELDVASTLINEANALLRQHGADPDNDGTGDDLPVLTEVIFDLGEPAIPPAPAAPKPAPAAPSRPRPAAAAPSTPAQPARPQPPLRPPVPPVPRVQPATPSASAVAAPASAPAPTTMKSPRPQAGTSPSPPRPSVPRVQPATAATPAAARPAPNAQPSRPQTGMAPPRTQTAAPASTMPPPKPQASSPSTLPHRQGATAKSAPAIPPKAQTGPREQPHITPASRTTTAAPEPLPQTGSATRLPPTQSRFQTAWPHSARSNLPDTFSIEPLEPSEPPPQPQTATPAPAAPPPPAEAPAPAPVEQVRAITEELKLLDTLIVGEVEAWLREELPALVVREISRLNERLRAEAIAHLRATLLPRISEHISGQIDRIRNPEQGAS